MMSSIWTLEKPVNRSWSLKCVPRFVIWHCRPGAKQTKGAWQISTPPAEDPLRQLHQAEQQTSKNMKQTSTKHCAYQIFIIVEGSRSQGQVNRFYLATHKEAHLCECTSEAFHPCFAAQNWRKYQGVSFSGHLYRIWASLSTSERKRCQIVLMRWSYKAF